MKAEQIHLLRRPEQLSEDVFELVTVTLPALEAGEVLVRNRFMSVDPYMRRSMDESGADLDPWPIRGPLDGPAVGEVVESRHPGFRPGDIVESMAGWQSHFISDGTRLVPYLSPNTAIIRREPRGSIGIRDFVGVLGIASQTAYYGLHHAITPPDHGTIVVSSAAGTVGSMVCQFARAAGLRVVASAGSDEKVRWLTESLHVDAAFNYKRETIGDALARLCPDGIDLVFENASPEHFSACLPLMNYGTTVALAGFVSVYDSGGNVPNIENFEHVLDSFLTIRSFAVTDYAEHYDLFVQRVNAMRERGELVFKEQIFRGLAAAPRALCSLFDGTSHGKVLVDLEE